MQRCSSNRPSLNSVTPLTGKKETFTKLPILSKRFSMSSSFQYYTHMPTLSNLVSYIHSQICKPSSQSCKDAASSLLSASSLDIDYDAISHAVIFTAYWEQAPNSESWTETISLSDSKETIEIGALIHEPNPDPEDIGFGGLLTVLGQDTKPSASSSFPSRSVLTTPRTNAFPNCHPPLPFISSI